MNLHIDLLVEPFPAEGTDEGFVVGVCSHVGMKVGRPVEGFPTPGTHVRFDGGVCEAVPGQVSRLPERPSTCITREWLLSRMDSL